LPITPPCSGISVDRVFARHLGKRFRLFLQHRHHLAGLAFGIEHDVADLDAVEARRVEREVLGDGGFAADLFHHGFLVQAVHDPGLEFVQRDAERIEVVVGVGGAVQAEGAAEIVGAFLDLVGGSARRLPGGARGQAVAHHLLDQAFELPAQLERTDEVIGGDDLVVDAHDALHACSWPRVRSGAGVRACGPDEGSGRRGLLIIEYPSRIFYFHRTRAAFPSSRLNIKRALFARPARLSLVKPACWPCGWRV
jgi:hypothetical protein